MLHRDIEIREHLRQLRHPLDQLIIDLIRIHIEDADPVETIDLMQPLQQFQQLSGTVKIHAVFGRILRVEH